MRLPLSTLQAEIARNEQIEAETVAELAALSATLKKRPWTPEEERRDSLLTSKLTDRQGMLDALYWVLREAELEAGEVVEVAGRAA